MHLVFGWHLDGGGCPDGIGSQLATVGAAIVGPMGLLSLLETQVGLAGPEVVPAVRIGQNLAALRAHADAAFFAESLETDGWATARELLRWRDGLVAGGWSGLPIRDGGPRLDRLSRIETSGLPLDRGVADRLAALVRALAADPVCLDINRIDLVDQLEDLPRPWPCLLDRLARLGVDLRPVPPSAPQGLASDLLSAQQTLCGRTASAWVGDGTLVRITAENEVLAADAVAAWLAADADGNADIAFVRAGGSPLLDAACARLGLPRPGGERRSPWRGVLQVLPLAFEAAWTPFDPARLLELLVIPDSPVPPAVGRVFARALTNEPGVGGPEWQQALHDAVEVRRASLEARGLAGAELSRKLERDRLSWLDWLQQTPADPIRGMARTDADRICRRVQRWAMKWYSAGSHPLFHTAAAAAGALAKTIAVSGQAWISRPQLGRMLDSVLADGAACPGSGAEAAPWTFVDEPGQIWAPVSTVLWWNFTHQPTPPAAGPWSDAEQRALAAAGVNLPDPATSAKLQAASWRRAVLQARERLILVQPRSFAGTAAAVHPVWQDIVRGRTLREAAHVVVDAAELLRTEAAQLAGRLVRRSPATRRSLPQPRRDWRVAPGLLVPRIVESASGIELLLGCRLAWTLRYAAKVRAGDLVAIADDQTLIGVLAHAVVADVLGQPLEGPEHAHRLALARFDLLLSRVAAPLELPGKTLSRTRARAGIGRAVEVLVRSMWQAGLRLQGSEVERKRAFETGVMTGRLDLLLADAYDRPAVLDLKWSRTDQHRRAEIVEGRAVQLATYAWLVGEKTDVPASAGYFMLKQARLLPADGAPFPTGDHVGGPDLTDVWAKARTSYLRHLAELSAGTVTADGDALPGEDQRNHDLVLQPSCGLCAYSRLCGARPWR